jgi:hypothetical protein
VIRCVLGPRLADMIGVPKSLWDDEVGPALHTLQATTTDTAGPLSWFVQVINDLLGDNVQMVTLKGMPVYLDIPSYRMPASASLPASASPPASASLPGSRHGSAALSGDTRRERCRSGAR